jgi:hypothetical protein
VTGGIGEKKWKGKEGQRDGRGKNRGKGEGMEGERREEKSGEGMDAPGAGPPKIFGLEPPL